MLVIRNILFFILSLSFTYADISATTSTESGYIDETHKNVSNKILEWSEALDNKLSGWMGNDSNITTATEREQSLRPPNTRVKSVDSFFQNQKYLDETEQTFVSLRFDSEFSSLESDHFRVKLGGQVALSKSKKRFKFFIDNATLDNVENILEDDESTSPELGFHYFAPEKYGIESKYSLGLRGIDPFVRARYYMTFETGRWYIEPSQIFRYSVDDKFEEDTTIYFDRHFENLSLFRFVMHRGTQETKNGMDYDFTLQYYWSPVENIGLRASQSFIGNTKYPYINDETTVPTQTENYGGIYDYVSSFSFRHNIWRKWFFYEVRPGVSFHKVHEYEPNYTLRVFLDFHFGKYH